MVGSFSTSVKLEFVEERSLWLTLVYGLNLVGASRSLWSYLPKVVCRRGFQCHKEVS